jgi:hypothetical protein
LRLGATSSAPLTFASNTDRPRSFGTMATVMCVLAEEADDAEADAEADDEAAGAELAEAAGLAEPAELADEPLLTEQPARASAATAASGRTRRGHRPTNVTFLDI